MNFFFYHFPSIFKVPVIFGAFIECVATCIYRVVSRGLSEINSRINVIVDSFIGTTLVIAGLINYLYNVTQNYIYLFYSFSCCLNFCI